MARSASGSWRRVIGASSPGKRSERLSDCMDLADRTVMLLGGSGLVGHAVARRVLAATPPPRRLVLVALFEDEVRAAARALDPYRGAVTIDVEWGNVFMPAPVAREDIGAIMSKADHRALVLGDLLGDLTDTALDGNCFFRFLLAT